MFVTRVLARLTLFAGLMALLGTIPTASYAQQAVAIGRALMSNPRLLMLDEVSLGLAPVVVESVYRSLQGIIAEGATVVLVEQDLTRALRVADRVVCMLEGRVVLEGDAKSLDRDAVVRACFGLRRTA